MFEYRSFGLIVCSERSTLSPSLWFRKRLRNSRKGPILGLPFFDDEEENSKHIGSTSLLTYVHIFLTQKNRSTQISRMPSVVLNLEKQIKVRFELQGSHDDFATTIGQSRWEDSHGKMLPVRYHGRCRN
jgi:hypothetical protein